MVSINCHSYCFYDAHVVNACTCSVLIDINIFMLLVDYPFSLLSNVTLVNFISYTVYTANQNYCQSLTCSNVILNH